MESKIYAFIDSQNLNLSIRNNIVRHKKRIYTGWQLDFTRFFIYIQAKYKVSKSFLFIGYRKEYKTLYDHLSKAGYTIIFKPTLDARGKTKGNVDAELVLHTVDMIKQYDKAIIVTGDGDFHCLAKYLIKKKKLYKILIPNQFSYSSLLREFKKYISFINLLKEKLELKK
ncbi:MAG: NYN domain-containing protein [bacterium]|nr:NYN domain-containing protein [bacterium]